MDILAYRQMQTAPMAGTPDVGGLSSATRQAVPVIPGVAPAAAAFWFD